ncbi:MAG: ATP-binding protein [bacterium]
MRLSLKQKIGLYTLGPLVLLLVTTLYVVHGQVRERDHHNIERDLTMASENLHEWVESRQRDLSTMAHVISRDPKFFAMLTVPLEERGDDFIATLNSLAIDFHRVAGRDLFDIIDEHGRVLARATATGQRGDDLSSLPGVRDGLAGRAYSGFILDHGDPFLVAYVPIFVAGEIAGVLRIGESVDDALASRLSVMTRSDVSFMINGRVTATTLREPNAAESIERSVSSSRDGARSSGLIAAMTVGRETYVTYVDRFDTRPFDGDFGFILQRSLQEEMVFLNDIRKTIAVVGCLVFFAVVGAGLITARGVTRPISSIVRAAQEMERGNYDYPVVAATGDEIEYLAERFNGMRESMKHSIARLQEVDRMKSNFIAIASHELRTPVTSLQGFLYLLREPGFGTLTAEQRGLLEDIDSCMEALTRVVQQVTDMSLLDMKDLPLEPSETNVRSLVADAVEGVTASQRAARRLDVAIEVDPELPDVVVDRERLAQALQNLVANALRFTPDGGAVTVAASLREDALEIAVRDTGIGIAASDFERIFERIYECGSVCHHSSGTIEYGSSGLGLGLPIAKGIVEAHGGTIALESLLGKGSVFTIRLPRERIGLSRERAAAGTSPQESPQGTNYNKQDTRFYEEVVR